MRLFVGIALPEGLGPRLRGLAGGLPGARWVAAEDMHLTLRFVGEVDRGAAEDLHLALAGIAAPAFQVVFDGLGTFGKGRKVHTLWMGVTREAALVHLRDKVESAAVRCGFAPEGRKFRPHVTIARLGSSPAARVGQYLADHGAFGAGPFPVEAFALFRSHLGGGGARYEVLETYPLAGSGAPVMTGRPFPD